MIIMEVVFFFLDIYIFLCLCQVFRENIGCVQIKVKFKRVKVIIWNILDFLLYEFLNEILILFFKNCGKVYRI